MPEPGMNGMPEDISDRTYTAINEQLGARSDRMSHDLAQYVSDLGTAQARATTEARQVLFQGSLKDLAALAHEATAAAKQFGVPDEWIQNGPPEDEE